MCRSHEATGWRMTQHRYAEEAPTLYPATQTERLSPAGSSVAAATFGLPGGERETPVSARAEVCCRGNNCHRGIYRKRTPCTTSHSLAQSGSAWRSPWEIDDLFGMEVRGERQLQVRDVQVRGLRLPGSTSPALKTYSGRESSLEP